MKKRLIVSSFLGIIIALTAFPQGKDALDIRGLGIGIVLGEPTGFNVKLLISPPAAFDIGLAWSFTDALRPGFNFVAYADYLFHLFGVVSVPVGQLGFYCGVGGLLNMRALGIVASLRIPLGVTYVFEKVPLDVFFEIVPGMEIFPETKVAGFAGIGIRYWLKW